MTSWFICLLFPPFFHFLFSPPSKEKEKEGRSGGKKILQQIEGDEHSQPLTNDEDVASCSVSASPQLGDPRKSHFVWWGGVLVIRGRTALYIDSSLPCERSSSSFEPIPLVTSLKAGLHWYLSPILGVSRLYLAKAVHTITLIIYIV